MALLSSTIVRSGCFRAAKTGVVSSVAGAFDRADIGAAGALSVADRPTPQDALVRVAVVVALHPLPGVARHIVAAVGADAVGYGAYRLYARRPDIADPVGQGGGGSAA